ncbi:hypothetical protein [Caenibacillus caldisaponilyticus]|uniref:hypothetical protein n=1 Tax=Caenibacillus caldisaponilyticus TaxID=1674942 RepID=UPI00098852FD|nr:hypothetical protein [Caenibacillus caldisaponilyticus]
MLKILQRKRTLTEDYGAWEQYAHLAQWLIELFSRISLGKSELKDEFTDLVDYSFRSMSKEKILGQSWEAFSIWYNQLSMLTPSSKRVIKELIENGNFDEYTGTHLLLEKL